MEKELINSLVRKIGEGDEDAFKELYEGLESPLFSFLIPIIRNVDDIKDVIQETFETIIRKSRGKITYTNCFGWIFVIAKCKAINFVKARYKEIPCEPEKLRVRPKRKYTEKVVDVGMDTKEALEWLDEFEQQVIRLHYIEDYTFQEIAKAFNKSESRIKRTAYAAKEILMELTDFLND